MEALKTTNELFVEQNDKIQDLERFCKQKQDIIDNLNTRLKEMETTSESVRNEVPDHAPPVRLLLLQLQRRSSLRCSLKKCL